tara:strand:+ start:172729 stop:173292 length:564 start_codon:yes stop_codon:yes gene_type:complete
MFYKKLLVMSVAILMGGALPAQAMSIEDAYKAIPKQQVTYDPIASPLDEAHRTYLNAFFSLIDMAVAVRVEMLEKMYNEAAYDYAYYRDNYIFVINEISSLQTPYDLYETQRLTLEALREQWQFFEQWHYADITMKQGYKQYAAHPDVQTSSRKLIQAYNVFMQQYTEETSHNKKAFYTHLCALDFL